MIPLYKLQKLHPSQAKRKAVKIFKEAEHKYIINGFIPEREFAHLMDILSFCIDLYNDITEKSLKDIKETLTKSLPNPEPGLAANNTQDIVIRSLNTIQYLIYREFDRYPSEWDFDLSDKSGKLDPTKRQIFAGVRIYLDEIRSPFNIGAIFRSAESFGVEKICLSPLCADPNHRRAQRTAMGCVSIMPWARMEDNPFSEQPNVCGINDNSGFFSPEIPVFALETGGKKPEEFTFPAQGIMIVGSEEFGVSPSALAYADASLGRLSIPVFGVKGSLNVSVAFGIAMHAWARSMGTKN